MIKKDQIENLEKTVELFNKTVLLVALTTRLMKAYVKLVERDTERRLKEGGEKK